MTDQQNDRARSTGETSVGSAWWKYTLVGSVFVWALYFLGIIYQKAVVELGMSPLPGLGDGPDPVLSFLLLLVASALFGLALLLHPRGGASDEIGG
ncbi:MAG: hypothetical protein ABEJ60_06260 [Halodesulfurarchaeum sp.]